MDQQTVNPQALGERVAEGRLPSNEEILGALRTAKSVEQEIAVQETSLSATGKAVLGDVERILGTTEQAIREKNEGEVLQKVIQHSVKSGKMTPEVGLKTFSTEEIKREIQEGSTSMATIVRLVISSAQFREILSELIRSAQSYLVGELGEHDGQPEASRESKTLYQMIKDFDLDVQGTAREGATTGPKKDSFRIPDEQKKVLAERFYNLMADMREKPEFQRAIAYILDRLQWLHGQVKSGRWQDELLLLEGQTRKEQPAWDPAKQEAAEAARATKKLLEQWGGESIDPLLSRVVSFIEKTWRDEDVSDSLEQLGHFMRNCLLTEGYLNDRDWVMDEVSNRFEKVGQTTWDRYRGEAEGLFNDSLVFADRLRRDPTAVRLNEDLSALYQHLFLDASGRPAFKPEIISDLRIVIPALLRHLVHVRSPDLQYSDSSIDFFASNVVVNVAELTPAQLRLSYVADLREGGEVGRLTGEVEPRNLIKIELYGLHANAEDIAYVLDKHHGFPLWRDSGRADIRIYGRGMDIGILLQPILRTTAASEGARPAEQAGIASPPESPTAGAQKPLAKATGGLAVLDAKCRIHALDLKLYETRHDWLYTVIGPIVRAMLRSRLESSVAETIKTWDLFASLPIPKALETAISPPPPQQTPQSFVGDVKQTEPVVFVATVDE